MTPISSDYRQITKNPIFPRPEKKPTSSTTITISALYDWKATTEVIPSTWSKNEKKCPLTIVLGENS